MIKNNGSLTKRIIRKIIKTKPIYIFGAISGFIAVLLLTFSIFLQKDSNQGYYGIKSTPSWVDDINYSDYNPSTDKEKHSYGAITLLSDTQTSFIDEGTYFRNVKKIISFQGVDKHAIFFQEYEPYYSKIYLNKATIIRNGKKIDKTKDVIVKIRDKKILDGNSSFAEFKKISFIIPGVQKDDIIDYSILRYENNQISTAKSTVLPLRDYRFIKKIHRSLIVDKDEEIFIKNFGNDIKGIKNHHDDYFKYFWQIKNAEPYGPEILEQNIPYNENMLSQVHISNQSDWGNIVEDNLELYKEPSSIDKSLNDFIKEVANNPNLSKEDKIIKFTRFVQTDVRYLLLAGNIYNFTPTNPNEVFKTKAGDCKGKTMLLKTMLNEIGVKSNPVLVSSDNGASLTSFLPDPNLFNHVILNIEFNGKNYFVDPTTRHQAGNLENSFVKNFDYGLIIKDGQKNLTKMPEIKELQRDIRISYDIVTKNDLLVLRVDDFRFGQYADMYRAYLDETDVEIVRKKHLGYYQQFFKHAYPIRNLEVVDNKEANILLLREEYLVPISDILYGNDYKIPMVDVFENIHKIPDSKYRINPYKLENKHFRVSYEIMGSDFNKSVMDKANTSNILFTKEIKYNDVFISSATYEYKTINNIVPAKNLKKEKAEIMDFLPGNIVIPKDQIKPLKQRYVANIKKDEKEIVRRMNANKSICKLTKEELTYEPVRKVMKLGKNHAFGMHCKEGYYMLMVGINEINQYSITDFEFFQDHRNNENCIYKDVKPPLSWCKIPIDDGKDYIIEVRSRLNHAYFIMKIIDTHKLNDYQELSRIIADLNGFEDIIDN